MSDPNTYILPEQVVVQNLGRMWVVAITGWPEPHDVTRVHAIPVNWDRFDSAELNTKARLDCEAVAAMLRTNPIMRNAYVALSIVDRLVINSGPINTPGFHDLPGRMDRLVAEALTLIRAIEGIEKPAYLSSLDK